MADRIEIIFKGRCSCGVKFPFLFIDTNRINKKFICPRCDKEMTIFEKGINQLSKLDKVANKNKLNELKSLGITKESF